MAAVMHCVLALCALACLTAAAAANGRTAGGHAGGGRGRHGRNQRASSPERAAFEEWKEAHGISYDSAAEENVEFTQWLENDESIKAHNRAGVGWELGHNAYSSHTWGQFKKKMGIDMTERKLEREFPSIGVHKAGDFAGDSPAVLKARLEKVARQHAGSAVGSGRQWETVLSAQRGMSLSLGNANPNVPEERDWVAEGGVVEPVPNQGNCGSCWSFSATGAIEGLHFVTSGELVPLSQQHLLSCDYGPQAGRYRDNGCGGGLPDNAFGWIAHNGGVCAYADAPYISANGKQYRCLNDCTPVVTVTGFKDVSSGDELALMDAVAQQPVSVGIDASEYPFMLYKARAHLAPARALRAQALDRASASEGGSGVLDTPKCGDRLDHAVLVVGYGTDSRSGKPYWKVRNSWGSSWGENGYVRMVRGKNMCGIAVMPSYPVGALRAPHRVSAAEMGDIRCNAPQDGDAKLTSYPAGSLLLFKGGQWQTVCADTTAKTSASLACTLLGYKSAVMLTNKPAPGGPYNISAGLLCDGSESAFDQCKVQPIGKDDWCHDYPTEMAAYVKCYGLADGESEIAAGALKCGTSGWGGRSMSAIRAELAPQRNVAGLTDSNVGGSNGGFRGIDAEVVLRQPANAALGVAFLFVGVVATALAYAAVSGRLAPSQSRPGSLGDVVLRRSSATQDAGGAPQLRNSANVNVSAGTAANSALL